VDHNPGVGRSFQLNSYYLLRFVNLCVRKITTFFRANISGMRAHTSSGNMSHVVRKVTYVVTFGIEEHLSTSLHSRCNVGLRVKDLYLF